MHLFEHLFLLLWGYIPGMELLDDRVTLVELGGELPQMMKSLFGAGCRWLTPVILAIQEAEIRKIKVQSQPRQIVHKTPS
jgi:hypothetical protein